MLLQAICGYFDLQATLLPRIETCSILGIQHQSNHRLPAIKLPGVWWPLITKQ